MGLALIRKEPELFPPDKVCPQQAVGLTEPSIIISHQLSVDVCPHISSQNRCEIHDRRPLACRAFPYQITSFGAAAQPDCTLIDSQMSAGKAPAMFSKTESEACIELSDYYFDTTLKYEPVGGKLWFFDLKDRAWRLAPDSREVLRSWLTRG